MKNFFTLTLCFLTLSLTAQEAGCTYSIANNYSSTAIVDDGTCVFGGVNVFDYDNDGNIAINDFIAMLSYFGDTDSDSDGVFDSEDDCIDETACNLTANPTEPCLYVDAIGVCDGICQEDADGDGNCDFYCGNLISHEGYDYSTVQIGEQCWFSENCRYLPEVSSPSVSYAPNYSVSGYYGTDVEAAIATSGYETYGVYYNWTAVMTEGICPSGWHISSTDEFTQLIDFLGGPSVAGYYMKSTSGWYSPNGNGSNSSGFNAVPAGVLMWNGFVEGSKRALFWSSSPSGVEDAYIIQLYYTGGQVTTNAYDRTNGLSARCIKD